MCLELWHWINELAGGDDPRRPKLIFTRVQVPVHSVQYSAFTATLFLILLDMSFLQNLSSLLTDHVHDGYRLLYKLLACLKLAVSQDEGAAARVVGQFVDALLMCHWCHSTEIVDTAACWEIIGRIAPMAMDHYKVQCRLSWDCSVFSHPEFGEVLYSTTTVVVSAGTEWIDGSVHSREHSGLLKIPILNSDDFERCPLVMNVRRNRRCRRRPHCRILTVLSPSSQNFIMRFAHGMPQNMWEWIMKGSCIWFNKTSWAVWGGTFEKDSGRTVCCYLINRANGRRWVRIETSSGSMHKNANVDFRRCREVLFQSPEKNCWCGGYNDWSMYQCNVCHKQAHRRCILPPSNRPREDRSTWDGRGCGHCEEERRLAALAANA